MATLVVLVVAFRHPAAGDRAADWVGVIESTINDLVFAGIAIFFLHALPGGSSGDTCSNCCTGCGPLLTSSTCTSSPRTRSAP
ncbi:MAG: hypothetical protein R2734_14140 [Nocardioides sp.]